MARQAEFWQWLVDALDAGQAAALLVVADSKGSSPGKAGAKMAVTADASFGTIGGGPTESRMVEQARAMLAGEGASAQVFQLALHASTNAPSSGAICGGEQTVVIYRCRREDRRLFQQALEACTNAVALAWSLYAAGMSLIPLGPGVPGAGFVAGDRWCYRELLGPRKQAYIIGAGHVGQALAKLLSWLDFDVTVIDTRACTDSLGKASEAWRQWRLDCKDVADQLPQGANVFVFIMTGHPVCDEMLAGQLATKQWAYLGLLGSRHKIEQLKARLAESLSGEQLRCLRAPMGLPIGSHSPEEIAVSIAAELIQLLNARCDY